MLERIQGCLLAGAAGDALGYAVEFLSENVIFRRYGERGITEFLLRSGKALISDDTQMTLFTANGLLLARAGGGDETDCIRACYQDWLLTQGITPKWWEPPKVAWLRSVPELCHARAPGNTCISALEHNLAGTLEKPLNQSKGCGGVMRVAPIGLVSSLTDDEADLLGAKAAVLTHGHDMGYIPAAMLVHIVRCAAQKGMSLQEAVEDAQSAMQRLFPDAPHLAEFTALINRAVALSSQHDADPLDAIHELGEGWVGDEALAIAVYCALRFPEDLEEALIAAVNHNGDSDSTGAITGNILGASLGRRAIPEKFLTGLEARDTIEEIAAHLHLANQGAEGWQDKYQ